MTENPSYKKGKKIVPWGIVVHSTGANNPYIHRYVGPDDGIIGPNKYNNHWNKPDADKSMHFFIGKVQDGSEAIYHTLPLDVRCWGVGGGSKGSYNDSHIQFEICEDGLTNEAYWQRVRALAVHLCAWLCQEYAIAVGDVVGHYEAHAAGYGSNHGDPRNWMKKFGDSMDDFRADVLAMLGGESPAPPEPPEEAYPILRKGDSGSYVTLCQQRLQLHGYALPAFGADGKYGNETISAVRGIQGDRGLVVDGVTGDKTWAVLMEEPVIVEQLYYVTAHNLTGERAGNMVEEFRANGIEAEMGREV